MIHIAVVCDVGSLSGWIVGPPGLLAPRGASTPSHNDVSWAESCGLGPWTLVLGSVHSLSDDPLDNDPAELSEPPQDSAQGRRGVLS